MAACTPSPASCETWEAKAIPTIDLLTVLYAVTIAATLGLCLIAVGARQGVALRAGGLVLAVVIFLTGYAAFSELLGRVKPASLEWARRAVPEATVLAHQMQENTAIYLWVLLDDESEPRSYVLPWDEDQARQLHEASTRAKSKGTRVRMRGPFNKRNSDKRRVFHAEPQPRLPPKRGETS